MKNLGLKVMKNVGKIAAATASVSANTTCSWLTHQAEVPSAVQKLKKIK